MEKKKTFARGLTVLKITNGFVYATLVIESACAPSTNDLPVTKNGNERVILIVGKERCIKEHLFSELLYVSCVYLFPKLFLGCEISFEV